MKIITFKSSDRYYSKEESGIKNNTVRFLDQEDDRLKVINTFMAGEDKICIKIENPITNKSFTRVVKDISIYGVIEDSSLHRNAAMRELYIITWEVE